MSPFQSDENNPPEFNPIIKKAGEKETKTGIPLENGGRKPGRTQKRQNPPLPKGPRGEKKFWLLGVRGAGRRISQQVPCPGPLWPQRGPEAHSSQKGSKNPGSRSP
ncbi:hypothetical protein JTE90_026920 [Oedothorax gibbosus]|uniref:Uncharacterized protein n=1 Tax=Oedothorax gibbosus TaxID=931172 RepID=A0AAV6THH1_9ARAC|nr:hypothetical protein JTE90_026920 [Oedothorax gibbosus]